jgi:hypothetical protein
VIVLYSKFLSFSDSPFLKPWIKAKQEVVNRFMPDCVTGEWFGNSDCRDRRVWIGLYREFEGRREAVRGIGFEVLDQEEIEMRRERMIMTIYDFG